MFPGYGQEARVCIDQHVQQQAFFFQVRDSKLGVVLHDALGVADQVSNFDGLYSRHSPSQAFARSSFALGTVAGLHVAQEADGIRYAELELVFYDAGA